jgi:hypothetical protein
MNFSTVPPYRPINVRANSKYRDNSARVSSASRPSEAAVNPTRSRNNTDTTRRSATGRSRGCGAAVSVLSAAPHSPQNFRPGSFDVPQAGQGAAKAVPHSPQNFALSRFSVPQLEQVLTASA